MKKPNGYWTEEKCKEVALKYEYLSDFRKTNAYKISSKIGCLKNITLHLKRKDMSTCKLKDINGKYNVNHFDFLNIINPEFSYILGFIWADGYLQKNRFGISIVCKYDSDIKSDYNTIKKILSKTGKWNNYNKNRFDKRTNKMYSISQFMTTNRHLYNFLIDMDYDKKSYLSPTKILNHIPIKLQHHFLRGYSDGDGCFYLKNSMKQYSITSTFNQDWSSFIAIFNELDIKKFTIKKQENIKSKSSMIRITNKKDIIKIGEYLYKDSENIRFERKYNTYLKIKTYNINKIT